jgi:hypothetical protein
VIRAVAAVILRSRALARRLEGWPRALVAHPSRLAEDGEHLRMTAALDDPMGHAHHDCKFVPLSAPGLMLYFAAEMIAGSS